MTDRELYRETFSHLHASAGTVTEVLHMAHRQDQEYTSPRRISKRTARAAIVAAICAVLLTGTVVAAVSSQFRTVRPTQWGDALPLDDWLDTVFGNNVIGSTDAHEIGVGIYNDDGTERTAEVPGQDRVDVDPAQAKAVIGEYILDVNKYAEDQGVTLTLESLIVDETGTGVLSYTLEDPNGLDWILDAGYSEAFDGEDAPTRISFSLADKTGKNTTRLDKRSFFAQQSEDGTWARYVCYFAPFDDGSGLDHLLVKFGANVGFDKEKDIQLALIPLEKRCPVTTLTAESGDTVTISPLGMTIHAAQMQAHWQSSLKDREIILHYQDGTQYPVQSDSQFVDNTTVSLYTGADNSTTDVFDRLADVSSLERVTVQGRITPSGGETIPIDLTFTP